MKLHGIFFELFSAQRPALPAAGEKQDQKRETAKAQEKPKKRAESQSSGARCVGQTRLVQDSLSEKQNQRPST